MQLSSQVISRELKSVYKIFSHIEGNSDCFNDVIVFRPKVVAAPAAAAAAEAATAAEAKAKFNLIFFGGDVQDYEEEMKKSSTSRNYTAWNLIKTGNLLVKKFASRPQTISNVFVFRADYFHLRTFANYSNFVLSTDFGIPIDPNRPNEFAPRLDSEDTNNDSEASNSSSISTKPTSTSRLKCWQHTQKLLGNAIQEYNRQLANHGGRQDDNDELLDPIDADLPLIICAFSKGCTVLNQLCLELPDLIRLADNGNDDEIVCARQLVELRARLKHFIWLDGGHSGSSHSWIVDERVIEAVKRLGLICYVYVTPYQIKSHKTWAIEEYDKFCSILDKLNVACRRIYYFQEKDDDFNIDTHFEILNEFDSNLII